MLTANMDVLLRRGWTRPDHKGLRVRMITLLLEVPAEQRPHLLTQLGFTLQHFR